VNSELRPLCRPCLRHPSQSKTLKCRPGFPARFTSIEHARAHCPEFFPLVQRRAPAFRAEPAYRSQRPFRRHILEPRGSRP